MSALIELSRGYFTAEHVTAMEESILNKLSWQVHPPTPLCFVRHLMLLLPPNSCTPSVWHDMMEVAKFQTELSVIDYYFTTHKKSSIALAVLLNVIEGVHEFRPSAHSRLVFLDNVRKVAGLDPNCNDIKACQDKLRTMYHDGAYQQPEVEPSHLGMDRDAVRTVTVSPVSVAAIGNADIGQHQSMKD